MRRGADAYAGRERRAEPRRGAWRRLLDPLYASLRWIGGHVRDFYAAVGVFLLLGLGLSAGALALFALVARSMAAGATARFDEAVVRWAQGFDSDWLDGLALLGAVLGSGAATWVVLGVGTFLLWRSRHHYSALLLWAALVGGRFLNGELKSFFGRPRPGVVQGDQELLGIHVSFPASASFPSGHAITSVIIFGTLAYLVIRLEPTVRQRRWTLAIAGTAILLIGASRVYLGVHYPSDVLAGYLAGFIWATSCALAIEAVRFFRSKKPEVVREEKDLEKGLEPIREAVAGEPAR